MYNLTSAIDFVIKNSFYFSFLYLTLILIFDRRNLKFLFISSVVLLGLIAVFRFNIGADYYAYYFIYEWADSSSFESFFSSNVGIENGFNSVIVLFKKLGVSYQLFIGSLSVIMLSLITHYILQNIKKRIMPLLVYYSMFFVVWNLSGLRQGLALTLALYLLYNPKYNFKDWIRVLIILALSTLHYSSLILLVFLFLEKISWNQKRLGIYIVICILFSMVPIQGIFIYLSQMTFLGSLPLYQKAMFYVEGMVPTYGFLDVFSLMRVFFAGLVLIHYPKLVSKNPQWKRVIDTLVLGMGIFLILSFNDLIAGRLSIYALILLVPILPMIVELYEGKKVLHLLAVGAFISLNFFFLFKDLVAMKQQLGIQDGSLFAEYHHIFENRD